MHVRITGGRVIDPASALDRVADLFVVDTKVAAVGEAPRGFRASRTIDARDKVVCPGLVDVCARLREPGDEHKATIGSECKAAASAGITTLCSPPDTTPVVDTPAVVELIHQRAELSGSARVEVLGALTRGLAGEALAEMGALGEAGCVGISNGLRPIQDAEVMRRAMEYATTFGLTVFLNPQDACLARDRYVHQGTLSTQLGMAGIPETAETVMVARDLLLAEQTGARIHFCHLSTARAAQMVAEAKSRGLPVSADVTAHHLHLTETHTTDFNSDCHVEPPLRSETDRNGLRDAVYAGAIDAICSDHQPHERDARLNPFQGTEAGISALETLLPLTLDLVDDERLDLSACISRLTVGPARVLGIDRGAVTVGASADICIFDPNERWTLSAGRIVSQGHNSPFLGSELRGRVTHTLLGGRVVYERNT